MMQAPSRLLIALSWTFIAASPGWANTDASIPFEAIPEMAADQLADLPAAPTIVIQSATLDGLDVTAATVAACAGKALCDASPRSLLAAGQTLAPEKKIAFDLRWKCSDMPDFQGLSNANVALDQGIGIRCSSEPFTGAGASGANYRHSYHSLVRDPAPDMYEKQFPKGCAEKIRAILARGGNFRSEELAKKLEPVTSIRFPSGKQDTRFYHWSKSRAVVDYATNTQIDPIFSYLRNRDFYDYTWGSVLFVAEDPRSSSGFGPYLIHLDFRPDAKVLDLRYETANYSASAEIIKRYPELDGCNGSARLGLLTLLAMEDTGVDLINYGQTNQWFILVNPGAVRAMGKGE